MQPKIEWIDVIDDQGKRDTVKKTTPQLADKLRGDYIDGAPSYRLSDNSIVNPVGDGFVSAIGNRHFQRA